MQALCSISIIFTCPGYWISQGISCGLESGHPASFYCGFLVARDRGAQLNLLFEIAEGNFLLSHVYNDLLLSAATTVATPSRESSV